MIINKKDQELFDILISIAKQHSITLRVAGGYVRDMIMGLQSNDIDIAVDRGSGLEFANKVIEHLGTGKVYLVKSNAEQSKHLETAIVNINDKEIQFCGFRKEVYGDQSRIPDIETGTIRDDCFRRDLTINSLYLNINNGELEDLTGLGLSDIKNKIVRTPLLPAQTFLDDPLRILRAIRFAARFNFDIDPEIPLAVKDQSVLEAFKTKVSRERIEIELRKIMTGPDPVRAIYMMSDFGILYDVFRFPKGYCDWDMDQQTPHHELNVLDHTLEGLKNLTYLINKYMPDIKADDLMVARYAILFHDLGKLNPKIHGYKVKDGIRKRTYYNHEKYSIEAAEHILKKLPGTRTIEIDRVKKLIDGARMVNPSYTPSNENCSLSTKALGKFARYMGDDWLLAIVVGISDATAKKRNLLDAYPTTYYADMINKLLDVGPVARAMKPLLDGNEIMEITGLPGGPELGRVMNKLIDWQLANPKVSKKDAINYVKSFKNVS